MRTTPWKPSEFTRNYRDKVLSVYVTNGREWFAVVDGDSDGIPHRTAAKAMKAAEKRVDDSYR